MLTTEQRFDIWDNYRYRIRKLFSDIEDDYSFLFAPFNKPHDKEAQAFQRFYDSVQYLMDFVEPLFENAKAEFDAEQSEILNMQDCFMAWKLGLCPNLIRRISQFSKDDDNIWDTIANFKNQPGISYEDTKQAIDTWLKI